MRAVCIAADQHLMDFCHRTLDTEEELVRARALDLGGAIHCKYVDTGACPSYLRDDLVPLADEQCCVTRVDYFVT